MSFAAPRCPALEAGCNLRDLGGHGTGDGRRVRSGLVYRSGVLSYLTPSDHARLAGLGLRTIVDLRRSDEIAQEPTRWSHAVRTLWWREDAEIGRVQRAAGWERAETAEAARAQMIAAYRGMPDWLAAPLRGIVGAIVADGVPLLFHCAAGKDRTGFCAAILLTLLGVPRETVLREFAYTNEAVDLHAVTLAHRGARMGVASKGQGFEAMRPEVRAALLTADPSYLSAALEAVAEAHGSVAGYAAAVLGVDGDGVAALRARLVEDVG